MGEIVRIYEETTKGEILEEGLGVRIRMDDLIVAQCILNNKEEDIWVRRKENTVMTTEHSTFYVWAKIERMAPIRN